MPRSKSPLIAAFAAALAPSAALAQSTACPLTPLAGSGATAVRPHASDGKVMLVERRAGAVDVIERIGLRWESAGTLEPTIAGQAISSADVDGDRAVVTTYPSERVDVFQRSATGWQRVASFRPY